MNQLSCNQVPSGFDERVVGYECPEVHQLFWFNLAKGPLHYVPSIDKYFVLVDPNEELLYSLAEEERS